MISQQTKRGTLTIVATHQNGAKKRHYLGGDEGVFVGRSSNCGLKLPDPDIADIHCRLERAGDELWIQDWMSNGGTRINGTPIWTRVQLHPEDVIEIGKHTISICFQSASKNETDANAAIQTDAAEPSADDRAPSDQKADSKPHHETAQPGDEALFDFDTDFLDPDGEHAYDRETVAILQAEIEQLRTELAQRDADRRSDLGGSDCEQLDQPAEQTDEVLGRMQELIDEANRSDERVGILEEMLHAAEDASRAEQEERHQLEAWVGEIEQRVGAREDEHSAELDTLRKRLEDAVTQQQRLQRQLHHAATDGSASMHYEETLEQLQKTNQQLEEKVADLEEQNRTLQVRLEQQSSEQDQQLRQERAALAQEQAKISRLRYELTSKLSAIEEMPKSENQTDKETSDRIRTLREHLREIHEQEKREEREAPLTKRLANLWKRVEA